MIALPLLLATLALTAGDGPRQDRQGDPDQPWIVGPWSLACRRDGAFINGVHIETCEATMRVGAMTLRLHRSPDGATATAEVDRCPGESAASVPATALVGADRARVVTDALRSVARAAGRRCGARTGPVVDAIKSEDVAQLLQGSDGLEDMTF